MLHILNKGVEQRGYRYLLQKNARCPACGGTLKQYEDIVDIIIECINCRMQLKVVDFGVTEGEMTVEVL